MGTWTERRNGGFSPTAAKHRKNPPKRKKERTALSRRGAADPGSGLKFVDRVLVSTQRPAAHPRVVAGGRCLRCCWRSSFGLLLVLSTGFGIAVPLWVWPAAAAFCAGWALFLRAPQAARLGVLAGVIVYLVVLFICQRNFLAGAQQCAGNLPKA